MIAKLVKLLHKPRLAFICRGDRIRGSFIFLSIHVSVGESELIFFTYTPPSRCIYVLLFQLSGRLDLASNATKIFELLVHFLCVEHIDYALELGLQGIFYEKYEESMLWCNRES